MLGQQVGALLVLVGHHQVAGARLERIDQVRLERLTGPMTPELVPNVSVWLCTVVIAALIDVTVLVIGVVLERR